MDAAPDLSGFGQIYPDFSNQQRWAPSARINDTFHQSSDRGQGRVMDNEDLEMTSPDPSLPHCVTPGKADKDSEKPFSSSPESSGLAPCHVLQAEVSLFDLVSGKAHLAGEGGHRHPSACQIGQPNRGS